MYRAICALALLATVAMASGCTMCAHPFDYCGPTFTGGCGEQCNPNARAGSVCSQSTGCTSCGHTLAEGEGTVTEGEPVIVATTDTAVR